MGNLPQPCSHEGLKIGLRDFRAHKSGTESPAPQADLLSAHGVEVLPGQGMHDQFILLVRSAVGH